MGNVSFTLHAIGSHHNQNNPHDLNKMFARFVDEVKAAGHNVTHAVIHHGGAEDLLDQGSATRSGAFGPLALAATAALMLLTALPIAGSIPAFAADQAVQKKVTAVKTAAAAPAVEPIYFFLHGGAGFTDTQSDIALPGVATGTPKLWPAGFMAGGGIGYLSSTGPLSFGVEAEADYDFTKASVGCTGVAPCFGSSKNSWFFAEKVLVGITLSQIMGYVPGSAQPTNWPVPITVPASINNNVMLLGEIGMAQRNVDLCAMDIASGSSFCGSQWKNGLLTGAQARFAVSPNVSLRVEYNYIWFNQTFTPTQSVPLFANTVAAKDMQRLMAGVNVSLPATVNWFGI